MAFDCEGVVVDAEFFDVLADLTGNKSFRILLHKGLRGNWEESFNKRLQLLRRVEKWEIKKALRITASTLRGQFLPLFKFLRKRKINYGIISGGFTPMVLRVAKRIRAKFFAANGLPQGDEIRQRPLNKGRVLKKLRELVAPEMVIAVGDGSNDVPMFLAADISVAFRAPASVGKYATFYADAPEAVAELLRKLIEERVIT